MFNFYQDIRLAVRILLRNPGFALIAAFSLALGIGANSAIFSLADALLLRPLPILAPSDVVNLSTETPDNPFTGLSYPNYLDIRAKTQSFDGVLAFQVSTMSVGTSANVLPKIYPGALVTDNFFQVVGARPVLGRPFLPEEGKVPGRDAVVVVSNDFWQTQLGGDPSVLGRNIRVKGIDFTIVGVAPKSFTGIDQYFHPAVYIPAMMDQRLAASPTNPLEDRSNLSYSVKARLKPGVSMPKAQAELVSIWSNLQRQYPENNQNLRILVRTELQSRLSREGPDSALIAILMCLVGVVLLIACANVASLLLGRARARNREMALRISLGATRVRLLSQLLTESLLLALLGGALGLVIGYGGIAFFRTIPIPSDPPIDITPRLDTRVIVFSGIVALFCAVLFGLAPALRSVKTDLVSSLKSTNSQVFGGRTIGRNVLVVGQIALSMALLIAAGVLFNGFRKMEATDPGFAVDHRVMLQLDTSLARYTPQQSREFYRKLIDQTRELPGVRSASLARTIPFTPDQYGTSVVPEGYQLPKDQTSDSLVANIVDEHFFDTLDVHVDRGRAFTADDKDGAPPVAVVNEEFAKTYWPNQDALGKRFRLHDSKSPWVQIVGVTKTNKYLFVGEPPTSFLYLPFAQNPSREMLLLVQTVGEPASAVAPVREVIRNLDSNQPVFNVRTLQSFFQQRAVDVPWMITELIIIMGLVGLTLALVGLYGLIAYSVSRRTQEIGIRMAIGATKKEVLQMVIRQGLTLSLVGIAAGSLVAFAVVRLLTSALAGLVSTSSITFVVVPVLLVLVTAAACYIPARRASMVDPMVALRYE